MASPQSETNSIEQRVQLNARVSKNGKRDIKMDAVKTELPIDLITDAIIKQFFADHSTIAAREQIYKAHKEANAVLFG